MPLADRSRLRRHASARYRTRPLRSGRQRWWRRCTARRSICTWRDQQTPQPIDRSCSTRAATAAGSGPRATCGGKWASAGFTTVGFSARAFLKIERPRGSIMNPAQIGIEYGTILAQARQLLTLPPDTPAILTGWSRGASFAVLVSTEPVLRDEVIGVVAIGLAEDEDLLVNGPDDETDDDSASTPHPKLPFDNYTHLAQLPQPCAVIQATHDGYFPAAAARSRFGPAHRCAASMRSRRATIASREERSLSMTRCGNRCSGLRAARRRRRPAG